MNSTCTRLRMEATEKLHTEKKIQEETEFQNFFTKYKSRLTSIMDRAYKFFLANLSKDFYAEWNLPFPKKYPCFFVKKAFEKIAQTEKYGFCVRVVPMLDVINSKRIYNFYVYLDKSVYDNHASSHWTKD